MGVPLWTFVPLLEAGYVSLLDLHHLNSSLHVVSFPRGRGPRVHVLRLTQPHLVSSPDFPSGMRRNRFLEPISIIEKVSGIDYDNRLLD